MPDLESTREMTSGNDNKSNGAVVRTPLPWMQLSVIYVIQLAEPISATVIYPFINQFIQETGITAGDERKTGYFAGILQSIFFFAEAVAVVPWGMASDRLGRRPVLLFGPLGLVLVMLGFGMSSHFGPLLIFRCMQGAFNGNIGVAKSVIGEITDSTNIADAFAFIPFVWTSGITVGPFIGGLLAQPADRWPDSFGRIEYLQKHPYFLPCLAASLFSFFIFLIAAVALKETLPSSLPLRRHSPASPTSRLVSNDDVTQYGATENCNSNPSPALECSPTSTRAKETPLSLGSLMKSRDIQIILINYAHLGFCSMSFYSLTPLVWSMSTELGGLDFSSYKIGMTMGAYGIVNAVLQIAFLGKAIRRFGPRKIQMASFYSFFVSFLSFPIANLFARRAGGCDWRVWIIVIVSLIAQSMGTAAYASIQIIMTENAGSRSSLGTMTALGQAVGSITRSLGPSIASSLHSISLQHQLAGGNAVYYIMMLISAYSIPFALMLPETPHQKDQL